MTLNGVLALILRFSPNSIALQAFTVIEETYNVRKILSPSSSLNPLLAKTNAPCNAVSLR